MFAKKYGMTFRLLWPAPFKCHREEPNAAEVRDDVEMTNWNACKNEEGETWKPLISNGKTSLC